MNNLSSRFFQTLTASIASTLLFVAQQSLAACEYSINNHWDSGFQAPCDWWTRAGETGCRGWKIFLWPFFSKNALKF
ncbi:MAG: hypothetical protein P8Y42_16720 [Exilibacterium sp.]